LGEPVDGAPVGVAAGTADVVDASFPACVPDPADVIGTVHVDRLDVDGESPGCHVFEGAEPDDIVAVRSGGCPSDRDAVPVSADGPFPSEFAPVYRAGTGPFPTARRLVNRGVHCHIRQVQPDDPVDRRDGFVRQPVEHPCRHPLVPSGPQSGVRDLPSHQPFGVFPRTPRHQPDQDSLEADTVRSPLAVTSKRMVHVGSGDERLDRRPDSIHHFGVQCAHDVTSTGCWGCVALGIIPEAVPQPVELTYPRGLLANERVKNDALRRTNRGTDNRPLGSVRLIAWPLLTRWFA
jgi:hypothetical protein